MLLGKHINRYYLRYAPLLLVGAIALMIVDYTQLIIPNLYSMVINGLTYGTVEVDGVACTFDMDFLLDVICMPMVKLILVIAIGRFLWRWCLRSEERRVGKECRL